MSINKHKLSHWAVGFPCRFPTQLTINGRQTLSPIIYKIPYDVTSLTQVTWWAEDAGAIM